MLNLLCIIQFENEMKQIPREVSTTEQHMFLPLCTSNTIQKWEKPYHVVLCKLHKQPPLPPVTLTDIWITVSMKQTNRKLCQPKRVKFPCFSRGGEFTFVNQKS